jgi:penicillin-insensitive murein endopeptidase
VARAQALALDGPHWQVMRPSRNRYWGHPSLISYIENLAATANANGWRGLLVGDLGQPRGGPLLTGHASHQVGLDVDIWLMQMPARRFGNAEREGLPAPSMLTTGARNRLVLDHETFTSAHVRMIKAAAQPDAVERVFVNPVIKQALCRSAGGDRAWLAKVRPWRGHDDHIHVRLACPPGEALCDTQDPPPEGDGCGAELASWLKSRDWLPGEGPEPTIPFTPMSALPSACSQVLRAPDVQRTAVK